MKVNNENELGKALNDGENYIELDVDLGKKVIRLKGAGNGVWAGLLICVVAAIPLVISTVASAGTASLVTVPVLASVMAPSIAVLGIGATVSAACIAAGAVIAAGGSLAAGTAALKKMRGSRAGG